MCKAPTLGQVHGIEDFIDQTSLPKGVSIKSPEIEKTSSDVKITLGKTLAGKIHIGTLAPNIGGQYDRQTDSITVNENLVKAAFLSQKRENINKLVHTALHEETHANENGSVVCLAINEVLTELVTIDKMRAKGLPAKQQAYHQWLPRFRQLVNKSGVSENKLKQLYQGNAKDINELNNLILTTFGPENLVTSYN